MAEETQDSALFDNDADLKEAEDIWGAAQEEAALGQPIGQHTMEINEAALERSSSSDRLQIKYKLTVVGGQSNGRELIKYAGLGSPKQAAITQGELKRLGINTSKVTLKTLPAELVKLTGTKVLCSCKISGEFYNINFQKRVAESMTSAPRTSAAAGGAGAGGKKKAPAAAGPRKF